MILPAAFLHGYIDTLTCNTQELQELFRTCESHGMYLPPGYRGLVEKLVSRRPQSYIIADMRNDFIEVIKIARRQFLSDCNKDKSYHVRNEFGYPIKCAVALNRHDNCSADIWPVNSNDKEVVSVTRGKALLWYSVIFHISSLISFYCFYKQ